MRDQRAWLRRIDLALALAGVAALTYTATRLPTAGAWGWGALAAAGIAAVFATPVAVVIGRRPHRMVLDSPLLVAAVLLLPGATAVVATAAGVALGTAHRLRREGQQVAVHTLRTVATFASSVALQALVAEQFAPVDTQWLLVALLLGAVHLVAVVPVPILRARVNRPQGVSGQWRQLLPSLATTPLAALTAGVVVLLVQAHGPVGLVGYAPVVLLLAMGRLLAATQQDRRRLDALYALALDSAEARSDREAFGAATVAAQHVVPGAEVRVADMAGGPEDLSVQLGADLWLVAARRSDAFTLDDADLLTAVGRLATTSAHRALLHQELERQERVKTALLAAAGHDLQTPLAVQQGLADTLVLHGDELDDEQMADLLGRIADNARRMSRTIAGLVDLERLELSDRDAVTCDAARTLTAWAAEADLPNGRFLELEVDEGAGTPVRLSSTYLERIVENLVANAARYSPREHPITLRVERDGAEVLLAVEDRGDGVPEADRERIFEALDQGTTSIRGSVGLGLFIVARFVEHGGGRIAVEDRPGGGASFQVRLAAAEEHASSPASSSTVGGGAADARSTT